MSSWLKMQKTPKTPTIWMVNSAKNAQAANPAKIAQAANSAKNVPAANPAMNAQADLQSA